ncbi:MULTISPECIES: LacI family DNA-binding transcriptional regulator [Kosmotoga]|uniref:Transcriptional regulator, LacI family n=1 Tax=Kosmotoga olearia (strain ATCC BAA-1733 / DSM 21960 / TBF 19.5.1) TaxID=521045 RepID=C5CIY2_KOSOT|nr:MULTISPECIES: LacI family DNA-binding transcriptional regulator [Kosmotoga]ACR79898.1 transcriptional regulator, LacI family [Kosmotoga olearia TBF 19.5.1]OAA21006.1 LacI family transcriptional regulator [Kosmotoga sp. DU53]
MRLNIAEVAKRAGVSTATVSRVLNNSPLVSRRTREKVLEVIKELGYVPNHVARSLRSKKTGLVATIIPYSADYVFNFPYFSIFIREVTKRLAEDGYHLLLTTEEPDDDPVRIYRTFLDRKIVDGFIILDLKENDERVKFLKDRMAKFVVVGRAKDCDDLPSVDTDNMSGAYKATSYLLDRGCRRVLFINGPKEHSVSIWRKEGYKAAYKKKGLKIEKSLILNGDFMETSGYELVKNFRGRFDAIFAASDLMAIGALKALKEMNRIVPVMGFDDIPQASMVTPTLSTIRQPIDRVGYEVADSIVSYLEKGEKISKVLDVELIIRESTEVD